MVSFQWDLVNRFSAPEVTRATKEKEEQRMKKYKIRPGSIAEWLLIIATGFTFWSVLTLVAMAVYA